MMKSRLILLAIFLIYHYLDCGVIAVNDCHRTFPSSGGTWLDIPPYWIPNCTNNDVHVYGRASVEKCLKGRTIYVIGNSIARGALFGILEMLGGVYVSRQDQKGLCTKLDTNWGDSCHKQYAGIKLKYLYVQFMDGWDYSDRGGFPFIKGGVNGSSGNKHPNNILEVVKSSDPPAYDNCFNKKMHDCLQSYFVNATSNDILIFTLGLSLAQYAYDEIDYLGLASAQAIAFRKNIETLFPGKVFRFSGTPVYMAEKNWTARLHEMDVKAFGPAWQPHADEDSWYIIDQWAINKGRQHLFVDHVHFPGPLTSALIYQILSLLCPTMGLTADQYKELKGKVIKVKGDLSSPHQGSSDTYYTMDDHLLLHAIPESCFSFFRLLYKKEQIVQIEAAAEPFRKGEDFPMNICQSGIYLSSFGSNQVYQVLDSHRKESIHEASSSHNVMKVPEWVIAAIPSK